MHDQARKMCRILIVDDEASNVLLLERLAQRAGYVNVMGLTDPRRVEQACGEYGPDIILLDMNMPHLSGADVMARLVAGPAKEAFLPVLVLTADTNPDTKKAALSCGAHDYLTKPFDAVEVLLRIRNLLDTRLLHLELRNQNAMLDYKVRERTRDLEGARIEVLERLSLAAEFRDDDTGEHTQRVGRSAAAIAQRMGLAEDQVEDIRRAAPLHDIGKIGIADNVLLKRGRLTPEEFGVMKTHTTIGAEILKGSRTPLLQLAEQIAQSHHERWDGTGYASGLKEEDIPLAARIVAVADVFDALTHERPYKDAWTIEEAVGEVERQSGRHFDPRVVEAFLGALPQLLEHSEGAE